MDSRIIDAARFAARAHKGQRRADGEPYINHPMRVAGTITLVSETSPDMVAAAWLHDVLEDVPGMTAHQLRELFGELVAKLVVHLTNEYTKADYPALNRKERKKAEVERLAQLMRYDVHTIKLADRYDNVHKLRYSKRKPKWKRLYLAESLDLAEALVKADSQLRHLLIDRVRRTQEVVK